MSYVADVVTCGEADVWYAGESRTVTVVGLKAEGGGEESDCDSHDVSILIRQQGPEALAEVNNQLPGRYTGQLFRAYGKQPPSPRYRMLLPHRRSWRDILSCFGTVSVLRAFAFHLGAVSPIIVSVLRMCLRLPSALPSVPSLAILWPPMCSSPDMRVLPSLSQVPMYLLVGVVWDKFSGTMFPAPMFLILHMAGLPLKTYDASINYRNHCRFLLDPHK